MATEMTVRAGWVRTSFASGLLVFGAVMPAGVRSTPTALEARSETSRAPNCEETERRRGQVDSSWKQTRDEHGIRVFKRDLPDGKLLSFKAVGVIDAPIDIVLSIVLDQDRFSEWAEDRSSSRVVGWIRKPVEYVSYDRIDLPWPVKDRDFVTRVRIEVDPSDSTTKVSYSLSDYHVPSPQDAVRGSLVGSSYVLEPVYGGRRTRATGVAVTDPRGSIPAWVVNLYQRNWPYDTIMAMRDQAKKPDLVVLPRLRPLYADLHKRLD